MNEPVPKVTEDDVRRIIARDFGEAGLSEAFSILNEYGKQEWNDPDNPRVRLAILKLADGDLQLLAEHTEAATQDRRDVLAWAEYPRWAEEIGFENTSRSLEQEVIRADWHQYCQWLGREAERQH
jgi:hypothetical protein